MIEIFSEQYKQLHHQEMTDFSRIVHKLLNVNYLTKQKEADVKDYYFISRHYELFKAFFSFMNCEIHFDTTNQVFVLINLEGVNHFRLRLNESIVLLILRLLYDEKMREVSLSNKVIIHLSAIHQKFLSIGLKDRRMTKTELKQMFSTFRHFNLIDLIDQDLTNDDSRLVIYPTLLYAVHIEDINEIYDKVSSYNKGDV